MNGRARRGKLSGGPEYCFVSHGRQQTYFEGFSFIRKKEKRVFRGFAILLDGTLSWKLFARKRHDNCGFSWWKVRRDTLTREAFVCNEKESQKLLLNEEKKNLQPNKAETKCFCLKKEDKSTFVKLFVLKFWNFPEISMQKRRFHKLYTYELSTVCRDSTTPDVMQLNPWQKGSGGKMDRCSYCPEKTFLSRCTSHGQTLLGERKDGHWLHPSQFLVRCWCWESVSKDNGKFVTGRR